MKKVLKKRTGFTLVELLIVIIIIGILAGAMLLVAGSGTDKAEATKIVSNLRSLKAAALMYYADNPNATVSTTAGTQIDLLKKYMDREITVTGASYVFVAGPISGDATGGWFVGLDGTTTYPKSGVQEKLGEASSQSGLLNAASQVTSADNYTTGTEVYMRAR